MSEPRKNHLTIDGGQVKEDDHVASYKAIPESDSEFRSSKSNLTKSKERLSSDGAEEKLLQKEDEAKITTRVDMADAKYVVGDHRNGDAKIELDANKRQFSGLTKEELLKYAEDPFWIRLRWFMFIAFWALWLCMLAGAIAIIVRAPKCAPPPPKTWFEIGPLSDMSSADYPELDAELPLLKTAKVQAVFMTPCPDTYQVLDTTTCLDKFKSFVEKAKKYSVKVIVDLTANFVSTSHQWFIQSENRSAEFDNYFTWATGKDTGADGKPNVPNNWTSTEDQPAWTFSDARKQYYLHQFGSSQPDLNMQNPAVVKRFDAVLALWMRAGAAGVRSDSEYEIVSADEREKVDNPKKKTPKKPSSLSSSSAGKRKTSSTNLARSDSEDELISADEREKVDKPKKKTSKKSSSLSSSSAGKRKTSSISLARLLHARQLVVDKSMKDDEMAAGRGSDRAATHGDYSFWRHTQTSDQPELDSLLAHWSHLVATSTTEDTVFTIAEDGTLKPELYMKWNMTSLRPPAAMPIVIDGNITQLADYLDKHLRKGKWPAVQLKAPTEEAEEEVAILSLLLPAAPVFGAVKAQDNDSIATESLSHLVSLRSDASIQHGRHVLAAVPASANNSTDVLLACARWKAGHSGYVVVYNPGEAEARANLSALESLPASLTVHHISHRVKLYTNNTIGASLHADDVLVPGRSSVLLSYVPKTTVEK